MDTAQFLRRTMLAIAKSKDSALLVAIREKKNLAVALIYVESIQFMGYKLEFVMFPWGTSPSLPPLSKGNHWELFHTENIPAHLLDTIQ